MKYGHGFDVDTIDIKEIQRWFSVGRFDYNRA